MTAEHKGSTVESFLKEEGLYDEANAVAIKRVIAHQLKQVMLKEHITKSAMATKLHTSRPGLDRLLDPVNTSITLRTLMKAAGILGKRIRLLLV